MSTDPDKHPHIFVNINITFPNIPCYLLDLGVKTSVNSMDDADINRKLIWQHLDEDSKAIQKWEGETPFSDIDLNDEEKTPGLISQFYQQGYSCNVIGTMNPSKVTGNIMFETKGDSKAFRKFKETSNQDGKYQVQLNHKINELTFGHQKGHDRIRAVFGNIDNGSHTIFNMFKDDHKVNDTLKFGVEKEPQSYFYFCKLVPHVFVDMIE